MKVATKMSGTVDVSADRIIKMPFGLFGFEDYTDFALIDSEYPPFVWLQSMQEKNLAFLLLVPFLISDDYEADIDDSELAKIGIEDPADVSVFTIVTIPSDGTPVTANFQGPVIINRRNNLSMQVVLNDTKWSTKHGILDALKKKEGK